MKKPSSGKCSGKPVYLVLYTNKEKFFRCDLSIEFDDINMGIGE